VQERGAGGTAALSQNAAAPHETPVGQRRAGRSASKPRRQRVFFLVALVAAVVSFDQWSKSWAQEALSSGPRHIVGPLNLVLTYNKGAAFSLGAEVGPLVVVVAAAVAAVVVWHWQRLWASGASWAYTTGFGLLLGGGLSNLCDRLLRHHHGAVVDFIQVASWWPTFNVADAAITVGAVTLVIKAMLFASLPSRRRP
jgi:signal peptidase II